MSTTTPARRFRIGIVTMLLLVTLLCVCLTWQVRIVRERQALAGVIKESGGVITALKEWRPPNASDAAYAPMGSPLQAEAPKINVPLLRQLMGDEPIMVIMLLSDSAPTELERVEAIFPEVRVHVFRGRAGPAPMPAKTLPPERASS